LSSECDCLCNIVLHLLVKVFPSEWTTSELVVLYDAFGVAISMDGGGGRQGGRTVNSDDLHIGSPISYRLMKAKNNDKEDEDASGSILFISWCEYSW
jgi:hypothetical protein